MTTWVKVTTVVGVTAWAMLRVGGVQADDVPETLSPLLLEAPALDAAALDAQSARGLLLEAAEANEEGTRLGIILWDELKPSRPNPPQPVPSGQGGNAVSAASR